MKISKIIIKNFKSFEDIKINFNEDINIFTGINNAGKTTVLEAIALWYECFNKLIKQVQKSEPRKNIKKGDYKLGTASNTFIDYREIVSVRSPHFKDVFYNLDTSNAILLEAVITDSEGKSISIGFKIRTSNGSNYKIELSNYNKFDFKRFNDFFREFPHPINVIYASPINALLAMEEFETLPKIKNKVSSRESIVVLRNRLYQLKKDAVKYSSFLMDLSKILSNGEEPIEFSIYGDESSDVRIIINTKIGGKDIEKGISLLGSGTLQIIEILLSFYEDKKELQIVLLDEPDSHIHRDIQKRLLNILVNNAKNSQIFLTTHNESLIRSSKPKHLFYLEKGVNKEYRAIINEDIEGIKIGLQPSKYIKILENLGSETALDIVNALEADKLILVEGKYDAKYIQTIVDKKYINHNFNFMYWSFDGIDNLLPKLKYYKEFFSLIKNGKSLWEKAVLVFDSDYITSAQRENLMDKLKSNLGIKTYIWSAYTIESTVLTELDKFKDLMYRILNNNNSKNADIIKDELNKYIDELVDEFICKCRKNLDSSEENNEVNKITACIKTRKDNVNKVINKFNIFNSDQFLFSDYNKYVQNLLNEEQIYHLADKNDFKEIVTKIYEKYEIDFDEKMDLFEKILENSNRSNEWFNEWNKLIDVIES